MILKPRKMLAGIEIELLFGREHGDESVARCAPGIMQRVMKGAGAATCRRAAYASRSFEQDNAGDDSSQTMTQSRAALSGWHERE